MKPDIKTSNDIHVLVNQFYRKVAMNKTLGKYFLHVNWEKHLPVMYRFWENALFFNGNYTGNPLQSHKALHKKVDLKKEDFDNWLALFTQTVDELFEGEKAELAKQRAKSISTVMMIKIFSVPAEI